MDTRIKEAIRYLGYGQKTVDEPTLQMIYESFAVLERISRPKHIYRVFDLIQKEDNTLQICNMHITSKHLQRNLQECCKVIVFAATLGVEVERQIHIYEVKNIAKAVVFGACAASLLEEYCDEVQEKIRQVYAKDNMYLRPRFSPGYGDFSIVYQKDILSAIDATKNIGLSMTESFMLTPSKSITAMIGISNHQETCHKKGCEACAKIDCNYRRSER